MDLNYYFGKKNTLEVFSIILSITFFFPCVVNASDTMAKEENSNIVSEMKEEVSDPEED